MNYTADTWFFLKLIGEENEKARQIWKEITEGKGRLVVPTVVIAELSKKLLNRNFSNELQELMIELERSEKIHIADLTTKTALFAGKLGSSYNMPAFDSVILATAISTGHTNVLADDEHFALAVKNNQIKPVRF